jgi:hypothetical protein
MMRETMTKTNNEFERGAEREREREMPYPFQHIMSRTKRTETVEFPPEHEEVMKKVGTRVTTHVCQRSDLHLLPIPFLFLVPFDFARIQPSQKAGRIWKCSDEMASQVIFELWRWVTRRILAMGEGGGGITGCFCNIQSKMQCPSPWEPFQTEQQQKRQKKRTIPSQIAIHSAILFFPIFISLPW